MKTQTKVLELKNQGKNIPEICKELNVSKGTVGFHLKNLGIKWDKKRSEETKKKIGDSQRGKLKKRNGEYKKHIIIPQKYKRSQEGYTNPAMHDYWPILKGEVEVKGTYHNSIRGQIKNFILKKKILSYTCSKCGCNENWMGEKMPLILDHIDGNKDNHKLENLRFLCSNCDSIQPTYKGRNKRKNK